MTRLFSSAFFLSTLVVLSASLPALADEAPRVDDRVIIDLQSEDWVTTKTARVTINVEAAVSSSNAGSTRDDMFKGVNQLVKTDWRLTSFSRSQDQTGLERWSAAFEARVPENQLGGLGDNVKKLSKAGMQLSVGDIDFSPTLDEMEAARSTVRTQIFKEANDQLAAINAAIPGRSYRIALINFTGDDGSPPQPQPMMRSNHVMMSAMAPAPAAMAPAERAEKVTLSARVVFAAVPDRTPAAGDAKR